MSWRNILKDTKSELKEMFSLDEEAIERYDEMDDEMKKFIQVLMQKASENPREKKRYKDSIYAVLGLLEDSGEYSPSATIDAESKAAEEYLENLSVKDVPEFQELKSKVDDLVKFLEDTLPDAIIENAPKEAQDGLDESAIRKEIVYLVKDMWGSDSHIGLLLEGWEER